MATSVLERLLIEITGEKRGLDRITDAAVRESAQKGRQIERNLNQGADALDRLNTLGAGLGAGGLLFGLNAMAQESYLVTQNQRLFERQVARSGIEAGVAGGRIKALSDEFGVLESTTQGAAAILLRAKLPLDTITDLFESARASAMAAGASVPEALQAVAVGVAYGRSEVIETYGIVSNASEAWERYAKANDTSVESMDASAKALAFANAIIEESKYEVDDLGGRLAGLPDAQNKARQGMAQFRTEVGDTAQLALIPAYNAAGQLFGMASQLPTPLIAGGTAAVTAAAGVVTLGTAYAGLVTVLGALAGPVGWVALVTAGLAGLGVAAYTVASKDDATRFIEEVGDAAAAELKIGQADSKEGVIGALDELGDALGGDAKTKLSEFRAELDETGLSLADVRNLGFEAARAMRLAQIESQRTKLLDNTRNLPAGVSVEGMLEDAEARIMRQTGQQLDLKVVRDSKTGVYGFENARGRMQPLGDPEDSAFVLDVLEQLKADLASLVPDVSGDVAKLDAERERLLALQNPVGDPNAPPPGGQPSGERTLTDLFTELEEAGTASAALAARLGEPEDKLADLETRAGLFKDALEEAPALGATEQQLAYLQGRFLQFTREAGRLSRETERAARARRGGSGPGGVVDAQQEGQLSRLDSTPYAPQSVIDAQGQYQRSRLTGAAFDAGADRAAAAARDRAAQELITADTLARQSELTREQLEAYRYINADTDSAIAVAAAERIEREGSARALREQVSLRRQMEEAESVPVAFNNLKNELLGFAGSDEEFEALALRVRDAGLEANITSQQMLELLTIIERMRGGAVDLTNFGDLATGGGLTPEAETAREGAEYYKQINDDFLGSLDSILQNGAAAFGTALATGDFSGQDAGGLLGGLVGAGATFLGNMILPGLGSFLGPFLGGLTGGLFGDPEAEDDRRRNEDASRRGGASSIEFNLFFTQTNYFPNNINDAQTQASLRRQTSELVEDALKRINPATFRGAGG